MASKICLYHTNLEMWGKEGKGDMKKEGGGKEGYGD